MKNRNTPPTKSGLWSKIRFALGFCNYPAYIEDRLKEADVRSALFLSAIVAAVEIGMIIRYFFLYVYREEKLKTAAEFFHYTSAFWLMFLGSGILFLYSLMYLRRKLTRLKKYSKLIIFLYCAFSMIFGMQTAVIDYSNGKMIIAFLTILMFVTVICIWRPVTSLLLTLVYGCTFICVINHYAHDDAGNPLHLKSADMVNYVTFIIVIIILEMAVFIQRYSDATKSYKLDLKSKTDDLTGIANMRKFERDSRKYMQDCISQQKVPVYLVFDIRNFHTFNDRFGYEGGDALLIKMGEKLVSVFPEEPSARESADCFCVLTAAEDYAERAASVRDWIRESYPEETYLSVRVGAFRTAQSEREARSAVDRASYAIKQIQNDEQFLIEYDSDMSKEYSLKQYVLNNLERAIKEGHIRTYYQPVVWSEDGAICGCEALARWVDPDLGFMSPGAFVPVLEEGRQIHKLDRCIYEQVCKRIRDCLDRGLPAIPISLNFSRLDFELMDAVGELESLVEKYRVPKEYLHVEITESALTNDVEGLKKAIDLLHQNGYMVWLDDFGAGYSSLNVLKDFRFDLLKIDMEFLKCFDVNKNTRKIVETIIELAEKLEMKTLAEGVEDQSAAEFLKEAGCGRQQGYYYGKPMPYEEILARLKDGTFRLRADMPQN